jgi:LmbE family N-acetylglucosaminyl deacetylase
MIPDRITGSRVLAVCAHPDDESFGLGTAGSAGLFLVFDEGGVTGHPDHCRATSAAVTFARRRGLPALAWTVEERVATAPQGGSGWRSSNEPLRRSTSTSSWTTPDKWRR